MPKPCVYPVSTLTSSAPRGAVIGAGTISLSTMACAAADCAKPASATAPAAIPMVFMLVPLGRAAQRGAARATTQHRVCHPWDGRTRSADTAFRLGKARELGEHGGR